MADNIKAFPTSHLGSLELTEEIIRMRAYQRYEQRGYHHGVGLGRLALLGGGTDHGEKDHSFRRSGRTRTECRGGGVTERCSKSPSPLSSAF